MLLRVNAADKKRAHHVANTELRGRRERGQSARVRESGERARVVARTLEHLAHDDSGTLREGRERGGVQSALAEGAARKRVGAGAEQHEHCLGASCARSGAEGWLAAGVDGIGGGCAGLEQSEHLERVPPGGALNEHVAAGDGNEGVLVRGRLGLRS